MKKSKFILGVVAAVMAIAMTGCENGLKLDDAENRLSSYKVTPDYSFLAADVNSSYTTVQDKITVIDCSKAGGVSGTNYKKSNVCWDNPLKGETLDDGVTFEVNMYLPAGDIFDPILTVCKNCDGNPSELGALAFFEKGVVRYVEPGAAATVYEDNAAAGGNGFSFWPAASNWAKIVLVLGSDDSVKVYNNGVEIPAAEGDPNSIGGNYAWSNMCAFLTSYADTIGVDMGFSGWKAGYIDAGCCVGDIKIYKKALSATQVKLLD